LLFAAFLFHHIFHHDVELGQVKLSIVVSVGSGECLFTLALAAPLLLVVEGDDLVVTDLSVVVGVDQVE